MSRPLGRWSARFGLLKAVTSTMPDPVASATQHVEVPDPEAVVGGVGGELHADGVVACAELSAHVGEAGMHPVRGGSGRAAPWSVARVDSNPSRLAGSPGPAGIAAPIYRYRRAPRVGSTAISHCSSGGLRVHFASISVVPTRPLLARYGRFFVYGRPVLCLGLACLGGFDSRSQHLSRSLTSLHGLSGPSRHDLRELRHAKRHGRWKDGIQAGGAGGRREPQERGA
jgi:hypothetical protein